MPYVKLDQEFPDHPKVVEAGPLASWLYICGLTYAARLMTDGYIPYAQVRRLADVDDPYTLSETLVEVGLWEPIDGGFLIHDYCEHQTTKADIEQKRAAGRAGGKAAAQARATAPAKAPATADDEHPPNESSSQVRSKKIETEEEHKIAPKPARKKQPDPIFDTLCELWLGIDWHSLTQSQKGEYRGTDELARVNTAVKQLRKRSDSTADEIRRRWSEAEARAGPGYPVTPQTITKSWTDLGRARASPNGVVPIDEIKNPILRSLARERGSDDRRDDVRQQDRGVGGGTADAQQLRSGSESFD